MLLRLPLLLLSTCTASAADQGPSHPACRCARIALRVQEIKITGATIFVNPYRELLEEEAKAEEAKRKQVGGGWGRLEEEQGACRAG